MMNDFRRHKEQNERKLELLEGELMRMDKKEDTKEQWIKDQLENIERRMDYVKTKNKRVQQHIDVENGKIAKEQDKYKDYLEELKVKLDEAEKDARMA